VRDAMRCDASVSGRYLARDMAGRRAAGGVATIAGRAKAKKMEEDVKIKARARVTRRRRRSSYRSIDRSSSGRLSTRRRVSTIDWIHSMQCIRQSILPRDLILSLRA